MHASLQFVSHVLVSLKQSIAHAQLSSELIDSSVLRANVNLREKVMDTPVGWREFDPTHVEAIQARWPARRETEGSSLAVLKRAARLVEHKL